MPLSLVFSGLALNACASTSAGEVEVVEVPPVRAEVSREAEPSPHEVLRAVAEDLGAKEVERMAREEPEKLAELGVDELVVAGVLRDSEPSCLKGTGAGKACAEAVRTANADPLRALAKELLPLIGTRRALPYLEQNEYDDLLRREMGRALGPCAPPGDVEIADTRAGLDDFMVLERDLRSSVGFSLRRPSALELDDLAYLLAAVADSGPPIGSVSEEGREEPLAWGSPRLDAEDRKALNEQIAAAKKAGQWDQVEHFARRYLVSLGYPGPLRDRAESDYAWGGARYSYVMRDLAWALEVQGSVEEAAELYRRAQPGGGACGTSVDSRREWQLEGLIRTTEATLGCGPVVAERLLDWDNEDWDERGMSPAERARNGYGPDRLRAAGFDVQRMYRGALVAKNRDMDHEKLREVLLALSGPLQVEALARLEREGAEAWEYRVRGLEGLADELGREGVPALVEVLPTLHDGAQSRTLTALGELTRRHHIGECDHGVEWLSGLSWSNVWHRKVTPFGDACETEYTDDEANALAQVLMRYTKKRHHIDVQIAAIEALGELVAPGAERRLAQIMRRAKRAEQACDPEDVEAECWAPNWLASSAEYALEKYDWGADDEG